MALPTKTHFDRVGGNVWADSFYRPGQPVGNVLYCHSDGTTTGTGFTPETAYSTLITAMGGATASQGDVVYVLPGHAQTVVGAAGMTFSKAGVRYQGVGIGRNRPTITFSTSTAAQILVTGANVTFANMVFDFTGIDAIVAAIAVDAADVSFEDCEFLTNSGTAGVVSGITVGGTTTSPRFRVVNCRFLGPATNSGTTTTAQVTLTDAPDFVFQGNYCTGKMTQSITNGAAILRGLIDDNRFVVATGTKAINMHASSTPFITNNRINVPSGTAPIVAAAGFVAGNIYSAAAGVTAGTASTI